MEQTKKAHERYIDASRRLLQGVEHSLLKLREQESPRLDLKSKVEAIQSFLEHAKRQIDQIERRVLKEEVIPHDEKVFSLFQPHTEWINKGKAGVPVELGIKVAIIARLKVC